MGTLLVIAVAVGVGVLVFRLTAGGVEPARTLDRATEGADAGPERASPEVLEVPQGYIPVAPGAPSWHARLGGAMGLLIAVAIGAIALALSLWALVSLVGRLLVSSASGA